MTLKEILTTTIISTVATILIIYFSFRKDLRHHYSQKQFECYNQIWNALCDLEKETKKFSIVDEKDNSKYKEITAEDWRQLYIQLDKTKEIIRRNSLLIEKNHLQQLHDVFNNVEKLEYNDSSFRQFIHNNSKLVDGKYSMPALQYYELESLTAKLGEHRGVFMGLLIRIENDFRNKIKGW